MFDFAWSEIALIGAVALVVIGPKDLPVAIRGLAGFVKKARKLASEFQSHVDEMVREADLTEVRDHVRDLRNLNVRGRIMKAIDGDGTLARSFDEPPGVRPAGPRGLDAPPRPTAVAGTTGASTAMLEERSVGLPSLPPSAASGAGLDDLNPLVEDEVVDAPPELPPNHVRRIVKERTRLFPPAILPPVRLIHGQRRVAPGPAVPGQSTGEYPAQAADGMEAGRGL
ncbi:Sec-independent protein translocase TatB [Acetobacter malorum DSM 14337]|uniref:Sec-independent protein translocase protein TatB n=1 Tax=Acetobacter malorum DSM 14337 TaxID=1307910 RepID=A0ABQ0PLW0_9PROT|nr:Sec-independent protein translocase protein TatB [Acetobacter malorum]GBQ75501.1 Sec-independent protein translocase TatB [Acetobacter malorum DSM 14337]